MYSRNLDKKTFYKTVIFSLLLHVLVLIFFAKYEVLPKAPEEQNKLVDSSIQVVLFKKNQAPTAVQEELIEELDVSADSQQLAINPEFVLEEAFQTIPEIDIPSDTSSPTEKSADTASDNKTIPLISTTQLRQMVSSQMNSYNKELTQQFVEACLIYKNRHSVKECPDRFKESMSSGKLAATTVFKDYGNKFENDVFIQKYEDENQQLATIIENGNSVSQELAIVRNAINMENIRYLKGEFIGDPVGSNKFCGTMPCVFRYTEFSIKQPDREEEPPPAGVKATWYNSAR